MPVVPINYWAVLAAAAANMILGFMWYGPFFGRPWMALVGFTPEKIAAAQKKGMGKTYLLAILGALLMSYIVAHLLVFAAAYNQVDTLTAGVITGLWCWIGIVFPVTLGSVLWEMRPWKLWLINSGYYLVALVVMGAILGYWQ